jgi:Na+/pantothenate symporter
MDNKDTKTENLTLLERLKTAIGASIGTGVILVLLVISIYVYYRCNKNIGLTDNILELLLAIGCPLIYIPYVYFKEQGFCQDIPKISAFTKY